MSLLLLLLGSLLGSVESQQQQQPRTRARALPAAVVMGYTTRADPIQVPRAVAAGVNVLVWSFVDFRVQPQQPQQEHPVAEQQQQQQQQDLEEFSSMDRRRHHHLRRMVQNNSNDAQQQQPGAQPPRPRPDDGRRLELVSNLNFTSVREMICQELPSKIVHLVSVGGWNAPHFLASPELSAQDWYDAFLQDILLPNSTCSEEDDSSCCCCGSGSGGGCFDGLDWDYEGNDNLHSPSNAFSMELLDKMGEISRLAKQDGYIVTMAPPQSYLDLPSSSRFSPYVNLSWTSTGYHPEFSYRGANVYAYFLAKYGEYVDLISIQLYESYSRAAQAAYDRDSWRRSPAYYVQMYLASLAEHDHQGWIDFSSSSFHSNNDDDNDKNNNNSSSTSWLPSQFVALPRHKLLLGLANGWALTANQQSPGKVFFLSPYQLYVAYASALLASSTQQSSGVLPRGVMFWCIDQEGESNVSVAEGYARVVLNPTFAP